MSVFENAGQTKPRFLDIKLLGIEIDIEDGSKMFAYTHKVFQM